jgi:hypothetical protein
VSRRVADRNNQIATVDQPDKAVDISGRVDTGMDEQFHADGIPCVRNIHRRVAILKI